MTAIQGYAVRLKTERDAFLVLTAGVWLGILSGFGTEIFDHVRKVGFSYPLILHLHAFIFVGWLLLFTTQVMLVRTGNLALHRTLGIAAIVWAAAVVIVGPVTALNIDAAEFTARGASPAFLSIQFTDIIAFAGFTSAALLLRRHAHIHKRLMLLGTIYISDAGFARWIGPMLGKAAGGLLGQGPISMFITLYLATDVLVLSLGAYDLVTQRRLQPAYLAGVAAVLALQITAVALFFSPAWKPVSMMLIGH